uniref:Sulfatase N-terminal domain-containing protein n=1 Tax=Ciona savignyi TaxID=51511 RepID=H2YMZ6_CIOSA
PHVVFVLADDLGYNDIGYNGRSHHSATRTPFLDSLARNGMILKNYYTHSVCSPTRGSLLTGRNRIHIGLQHDCIHGTQIEGLPLDNVLLPEQLTHCGYNTQMIGKWHLGFSSESYLPWKRGFRGFYGFLTGSENYWSKHTNAGGIDFTDSDHGPTNATWGKFSSLVYAERAKHVISNHDKSKPLFLFLSLQTPHSPLGAPAKYYKPFRKIKDKKRKQYLSMVAALDETVRNVTSYLQDAGMWSDTLLIFSTDNGGNVNEGGNNWPYRGSKNTMYEGGNKAVGFVHGPLLGVGSRGHHNMEQLFHVSDWYPTIMEATKCQYIAEEHKRKLDGYNQWDVLRGRAVSQRYEIVHTLDPINRTSEVADVQYGFDVNVQAAIMNERWKLLTGNPGCMGGWYPPAEAKELVAAIDIRGNKTIQLYDIVSDPLEQYEVSSLYPAVVKELLERLAYHNSTARPPISRASDDKNACLRWADGYIRPWRN